MTAPAFLRFVLLACVVAVLAPAAEGQPAPPADSFDLVLVGDRLSPAPLPGVTEAKWLEILFRPRE